MDRGTIAKELFENGYNCSQAIVLAFKDLIDIKEKDLKSLARLKEEFNKNEVYDTPFLHCESVLLKEEK